MPSSETFSIKPITELVSRYLRPDLFSGSKGRWIDPFARNSIFKTDCEFTNDINPHISCTHNMDALNFLNALPEAEFDGVLFDPPYSPRQIKEQYNHAGLTEYDTSTGFYGDRRRAAAKRLKIGGLAITCGWSSGGLGKNNGMDIIEILLVCHGSAHNDTIITVEKKIHHQT